MQAFREASEEWKDIKATFAEHNLCTANNKARLKINIRKNKGGKKEKNCHVPWRKIISPLPRGMLAQSISTLNYEIPC